MDCMVFPLGGMIACSCLPVANPLDHLKRHFFTRPCVNHPDYAVTVGAMRCDDRLFVGEEVLKESHLRVPLGGSIAVNP